MFTCAETVETIREKLFDHCRRRNSVASLYCFMPDHLHVIVWGQSDEAMPKAAMDGFKIGSGIWLRRHSPGFRWQTDYHDRIIRDHAEWCHKVRYILNNPVRAGLVNSFEDYPFLGSQKFAIDEILMDLGE